jgi:hypothetical protein
MDGWMDGNERWRAYDGLTAVVEASVTVWDERERERERERGGEGERERREEREREKE